jgi:hypothetical protein
MNYFNSLKSHLSFIAAPVTAIALLLSVAADPAMADSSKALALETHAGFFSTEVKLKQALDPQVFVEAPSAEAATGPQGIKHVAGFRNALVADDSTREIFTGDGKPMNITLGQWLSAKGDVVLTPMPRGAERVDVAMSGLKPNGLYSLFENHFDQMPVGFTPLDGYGKDNSFVASADGRGAVSIMSPSHLTHDNAVLIVYHSDGQTHGKSRGEIGLNAHHQLIVRP